MAAALLWGARAWRGHARATDVGRRETLFHIHTDARRAYDFASRASSYLEAQKRTAGGRARPIPLF